MSTWPHEDLGALNAFYGDPRGRDGEASLIWQDANLVMWVPPFPLFYSDADKTPLHHLRVHRKCLATFRAAFGDALETLGHAYLMTHRLDISGGAFCFRTERGGSRLSVHSWGCAIDIDPGHNPFPHRWIGPPQIDQKFTEILKKHGFCWRGEGHDIDPMHFQLCQH